MAELVTAVSLRNARACHPKRDHRVSPLCGGPVMTNNYSHLINARFTLPSSRVQPSTRSAMASHNNAAAAG